MSGNRYIATYDSGTGQLPAGVTLAGGSAATAFGVYTPTVNTTVGFGSIVPRKALWVRVGDNVVVHFHIDIVTNAGGGATARFNMDLPVARTAGVFPAIDQALVTANMGEISSATTSNDAVVIGIPRVGFEEVDLRFIDVLAGGNRKIDILAV
jgi:hypothetical protein